MIQEFDNGKEGGLLGELSQVEAYFSGDEGVRETALRLVA